MCCVDPTVETDATQDEEQISRNVQALKNRLRGKGRRRGMGRLGSGAGRDSHASEYGKFPCFQPQVILMCLNSSDTAPSKKKAKTKSQRKWGDQLPTEEDMAELDFSTDKPGSEIASMDLQALVDKASMGTRGQDGLYEVKDWEFTKTGDREGDFVSRALALQEKDSQANSSSLGVLGSMFARLTGSKVLTEADLKPVLESMKQHLMKKNVAKEISEKICEGVGEGLVGKKVGGFQSKKYRYCGNCHFY